MSHIDRISVGTASGWMSCPLNMPQDNVPNPPVRFRSRELAIENREAWELLERLLDGQAKRDTIAQQLCLLALRNNTLFEIIMNPDGTYIALVRTLPALVTLMFRTGIAGKLYHTLKPMGFQDFPTFKKNLRMAAQIQSPLASLANTLAKKEGPKWKWFSKSARYINYATAAYGNVVLAAGCAALKGIPLMPESQSPHNAKKSIATSLGIKVEDILRMPQPGGKGRVIPHLIAVDIASKSLVLAIRGTFSFTNVCTDLSAAEGEYLHDAPIHNRAIPCSFLTNQNVHRLVDFCGGKAHEGMAEEAKKLVKNKETMKKITKFLKKNRIYRLMITGHSLGAGVASLLYILLHYKNHAFVKMREVRCISFGCPPVFSPPEKDARMPQKKQDGIARVKAALDKTICVINRHDVVPFLHVDSIGNLIEMMGKVNGFTRDKNADQINRILSGDHVPDALVEIVKLYSFRLKDRERGKRLEIPAFVVLWMNDGKCLDSRNEPNVVCCLPSDLSTLPIRMSDLCVLDHMTYRYQTRMANITEILKKCGLKSKTEHHN